MRGDRVGGGSHRGFGVQHLQDAVRRHCGARRQEQQHRRHHHRDEDLDQVVQEGGHLTDLDVAGVDAEGAEPDHRHRGDVHHEHGDREQQHHPAGGAQRDGVDVLVGALEALRLVVLANEGADHSDAADLFTQHPVEVVEVGLHPLEQGRGEDHQQRDRHAQHRDADRDDPRQPEVLAHRHDKTTDHHDGCPDDDGQGGLDDRLHLQDVVGGAGQQRRCPDVAYLAGGERQGPVEDGGPEVAAQRHGGEGTEPGGADLPRRLHQGEQQHQGAAAPNQVGVAFDDAVVDDLRVQVRQVQRHGGRQHLEDQDG